MEILWSFFGSFLEKCDYDRTGKENIATIDRVRQGKTLYEICK